jgi:outer membrane protein OmpA-like peptidoglycan-associated protein
MNKSLSFALSFASFAAASLAGSGDALAQRSGFAVDRFEPSERGSQFFAVDTLDLRGGARPALGAVLDYGYKPLVAYDPNGDEKAAIVRHQLFTHLGGSLVLADSLRLALNVPVALYQDGEPAVVNGDAFKPADKPAIGDVRVAADLRLVGRTTDPFTLALGVRAWLPTGQRSQFTGDGSARVAPQVLAAGDLGLLTYGARLAVVYRARDDDYAGSSLGSELLGAAGVGIRAAQRRLVVGPELFASSVMSGDAFFKTRGTPAEWLFGLHYDVTRDLRFGAGVGGGLTRGYGAPELRTLASLEWAPAYESDQDGDGIVDEEDACPTVRGLRDPDPKKNGCPPEPPADRDQDGIPDALDACPDVPGVSDPDPKKNGCPPDRDGDQIPDPVDACPDVPGVQDPDPHKNGCPPDRDGDQIPDAVDACPDVKGVADPDPKKNGCPPPPPDTDGDGILDPDDACPKVAGPKNPDPKKNGCPLVVVTEKEIKIGEQVKFKFNSAEILKESDTILDAVKKTLDEHPEIVKLRVEGHTDNVGQAAYNKQLSQRRAASVMKWLTDHGVDKKRMVAAGFGMEEPIDTNATEEGRANNRRVAFTILQRDESKKKKPAAAPTPGTSSGTAPAPAPAPAPKP